MVAFEDRFWVKKGFIARNERISWQTLLVAWFDMTGSEYLRFG